MHQNPFERLGDNAPWTLAGRAGDTGLLALAPTSTNSIAPNSADPAWQRSIEISPTVGPQAGPMMLFDAGIAQGEQFTAIAAPRWIIKTSPTGAKTAMMVNTAPVRNMAQSTSSATAAARISTNPLNEPPIAPQTDARSRTNAPSGDGTDGGGVDYGNRGGGWEPPGVVDGESAISDMLARQAEERQAAFYASMAAEEAARKAASNAAIAAAMTPKSSPLIPLLIAGGAIAALAWWVSNGSGSKGA